MNILEELKAEGFKIYLAAQDDGYTQFLEDSDIEFIPLKQLSRTTKNPIKDIAFIIELFRIVKSVQPDFTIHYTIKPNIYGGVVTSLLRIPYFSVVTGLGYAFIHNGWLRQLTFSMYKIGLKHCNQVIFENNDDLQVFIDEEIIRPSKGTAINGCGVDTEYFKSNQPLNKDNKLVFTYIGRLLYDKGLRELMTAFESVKQLFPDSELWLVGKRDLENPACISNRDFADWLEKEGVCYKGYTEDVRPYIEGATCIVYPSYREGMPRLVLEAMSMQKPVITTDVPGCRETVIHKESGYIIPVKDEDALFTYMSNIGHKDALDLAVMGEKARKRAIALFNHKKISKELMDIFYSHLPSLKPSNLSKKAEYFEEQRSEKV